MPPVSEMTPKTITVAGNFVDMTIGTSSESQHNQRLFLLYPFFIREEDQLVLGQGVLELAHNLTALFTLHDSCIHKWSLFESIGLVPEVFMETVMNGFLIQIQLPGQRPPCSARVTSCSCLTNSGVL